MEDLEEISRDQLRLESDFIQVSSLHDFNRSSW